MDDVSLAAAAGSAFIIMSLKRKKKRNRQIWMRTYLARRKPSSLCNELDDILFKKFTRMSRSDFELLLNKVGPLITKKTTNMREPISAPTKLALTLRFLATGDSYKSLMYLFRISDSCIALFIPTVCKAIAEVLREYIKLPTSVEEWKTIAKDYEDIWNFPHCLGSLDGKHVRVRCPNKSGSHFFNYKKFHSIVLFAVVDAHYRFLYVNVGCQGRISDGGVFANTSFGTAVMDKTMPIPPPEPLPGRERNTPYVFVADDAFPLSENIIKPYPCDLNRGSPKRVCNYRISRARRVVENVFGLLSSVFRILHTSMELEVESVKCATMATVYLHNFLRRNKRARQLYTPPAIFDIEDTDSNTIIPGQWRNNYNAEVFTDLERKPRNASALPKLNRDEFMHYFMSERGSIPWQSAYL